MNQLIAHLIGDYVLQNHWMAAHKTSRAWPALVHVFFYGLPFLASGVSWAAWTVIVGTHFVIDRYRLARLWVDAWGVGRPGWLMRAALPGVEQPVEAPPWMGAWLVILVDNTAHLTINALAIWLLP